MTDLVADQTPLAPVVHRTGQRLQADPSRVVVQLFVPGQEPGAAHDGRTRMVMDRLLALDEDGVRRSMADVRRRFATRHRDLDGILRRHAAELTDRLDDGAGPLSADRLLLLGATFTSEYAIEGAALCNPSIIAHPDQTGAAPGALRVVLSVREVGEGHRSSLGFRTGTVTADGRVEMDPPTPLATTGRVGPGAHEATVFRAELADCRDSLEHILHPLGEHFTAGMLRSRLDDLRDHGTLHGVQRGFDEASTESWTAGGRTLDDHTIERVRALADRSYSVEFPGSVPLGERVLRPAVAVESHGMEDARFLRFVDDDGTATYHATYTAYDGWRLSQQLLQTDDFVTFSSRPLVGRGATNKGLALFPRRIGGRYAALSRADREANSVAFSDNIRVWESFTPVQVPTRSWELVQLGNCGPPIETPAGWLVLTHGVGPMRTYRIGAMLLDLDDPTTVRGQLREPLLSPAPDEQDGYVPNVVYSCGALVHSDTLVLPYGIGDAAIGVATTSLTGLLEALLAAGP